MLLRNQKDCPPSQLGSAYMMIRKAQNHSDKQERCLNRNAVCHSLTLKCQAWTNPFRKYCKNSSKASSKAWAWEQQSSQECTPVCQIFIPTCMMQCRSGSVIRYVNSVAKVVQVWAYIMRTCMGFYPYCSCLNLHTCIGLTFSIVFFPSHHRFLTSPSELIWPNLCDRASMRAVFCCWWNCVWWLAAYTSASNLVHILQQLWLGGGRQQWHVVLWWIAVAIDCKIMEVHSFHLFILTHCKTLLSDPVIFVSQLISHKVHCDVHSCK